MNAEKATALGEAAWTQAFGEFGEPEHLTNEHIPEVQIPKINNLGFGGFHVQLSAPCRTSESISSPKKAITANRPG